MITNNLTLYVNSEKVINGNNFKAQIISSSDLDPIEQVKNGISGLNLGNCINILKKHYKIPNEEDLIIVEIETKEDKEKNKNLNKKLDFVNLGKNVQVSIYDKSNRKLDISYCDEITIMKSIGDLEDVDFTTAKKMADQGVDVFNVNDTFFNDICHPFKSERGDIIIKDRRDDLFQNVTFCGEGCLYNGIDYNYMIAKCICDAVNIQTGEDNNLGLNNERKGVSLNDIVNTFKGQLFNFNFKVITCFNLVFDSDILKRNLGFIVMISIIGIELFLFLFFTKDRLKHIRNYMLVFEPFDPNIDPPNPPKKNKELEILNSENNKLSNLSIENKNNDEKENKLNEKRKETEIEKSIHFNNLILRKKPERRNSIFNEFLNKNNFNNNKTHNNNENDDTLVVQYLNNNKGDDNSYDINVNNNLNDSSNMSNTESNIDNEIEGRDRRNLGISVHNIHNKNDNDNIIKFGKDRYKELNYIDNKNKTINLEENKNRKNQRDFLKNKLNKYIKINSPEKKNSNMLYRISPTKRKSSSNITTIQYLGKVMVGRVHNRIISLDNENEINIDENKEKENKETIVQLGEDIKIHKNRKKYLKYLKNNLKLDNLSQMFSTEVLLSNNDKKLKNLIKRKKDRDKDYEFKK